VVLDVYSHEPVPYAEVWVEGREPMLADSAGLFRVEADSQVLNLSVSRVGYHPLEQHVRAGAVVRVYLQPKVLGLGQVTVSAARTPLPLGRAGAVRVLDRNRAWTGTSTDPAEAVRHVSSVLGRDYANYTSVSLRGTGAEHTLVALDGVPQNSAQNPVFDLSTMPLNAAERLEIVRGGGSAVFGSSAVGGVVNIITPTPERLGAEIGGSLGSFGRRAVDFRHTHWVAPLGYLVAGQFYSCRNDFTWRDSLDTMHTMRNSDLLRRALLAKGRLATGPHSAELLGEFSATERGTPGTTDWPSDSARRDDTRGQLIGRYSFHPATFLRGAARVHYLRSWQNYRDPAWFTNDTHQMSVAGAALDASAQVTRHVDLTLGGEATQGNLRSTAVGWPRRSILAGILQFRVQALGFDVVHLLRYEWLTSAATLLDSSHRRSVQRVLSPKVTATYSGLPMLDLYTSMGRSFRAPSFNDLYWPADAYACGNPRLRPETGTSYELGAKARPLPGLFCHASGFLSFLTELIQWQPDSLFRFSPVNVARARILGAELELGYEAGPVRVELDAALTRAVSDSLELIYRPRLAGGIGCSYRFPLPALVPRLGLRAGYTGARWADPTNTTSLPAFATIDAELRVRPRLGRVRLDAGAGVRNLLDTSYETTHGYPCPGRNWYAELGLAL
jgi:outer membrane receptor protein involved in Fe transport